MSRKKLVEAVMNFADAVGTTSDEVLNQILFSELRKYSADTGGYTIHPCSRYDGAAQRSEFQRIILKRRIGLLDADTGTAEAVIKMEYVDGKLKSTAFIRFALSGGGCCGGDSYNENVDLKLKTRDGVKHAEKAVAKLDHYISENIRLDDDYDELFKQRLTTAQRVHGIFFNKALEYAPGTVGI